MTRYQTLRPALPAILIGASIILGACASTPPPVEQVAVSTAAVASATRAGGPEWAAVEMRMAREKLDRANLAMTAKEHDSARMFAQQSQVDAQLAEAKAHSSKARKAADEAQEANRVLSEEMQRKAPASTTTPRN